MISTWLKQAELPEYSEVLTSLTLTGNYGKQLDGHGYIAWTTRGITIHAQTNGVAQVLQELGGGKKTIGKLLPDNHYFRLDAKTQSGKTLVIDRVMPTGSYIHSESEYVAWKWEQNDILSIVQVTDNAGDKSFAGRTEILIVPQAIKIFPRSSTTHYENPVFGTTSTALDWLQYRCKLGTVSMRNRESGTFHVCLTDAESTSFDELFAIVSAVSFLSGRAAGFHAIEMHSGEATIQRFGWLKPKKTQNRLSPPIDSTRMNVEAYESFLAKMTDYFLSERGANVANLLFACHDSVDDNITTRAMVVCAALEGLLKPYSKELTVTSGLSADDKEKVITFCSDEGFSETITKRLQGFMSGMESPSVDQVLQSWIQKDFLNICQDDHKAWKSLRNRVMHGERITGRQEKKLQQHITDLDRMINMLNKITMHEAGYTGKYYDCSVYGYRNLTKPLGQAN